MAQYFNTNVMERFMAPEEFKKFIEKYRANSSKSYRFNTIRKPFAPKELELLHDYFMTEV